MSRPRPRTRSFTRSRRRRSSCAPWRRYGRAERCRRGEATRPWAPAATACRCTPWSPTRHRPESEERPMRPRLALWIAFALLVLLVARAAHAAGHAHVHGVARLDVAVDG